MLCLYRGVRGSLSCEARANGEAVGPYREAEEMGWDEMEGWEGSDCILDMLLSEGEGE